MHQELSRRSLLKGEGAARAGVSALRLSRPAEAFPEVGDQVIPWLDRPAPDPVADVLQSLRAAAMLDAPAGRRDLARTPASRVPRWQAEVVSPSRSGTIVMLSWCSVTRPEPFTTLRAAR